jgi:hypothetical protein
VVKWYGEFGPFFWEKKFKKSFVGFSQPICFLVPQVAKIRPKKMLLIICKYNNFLKKIPSKLGIFCAKFCYV